MEKMRYILSSRSAAGMMPSPRSGSESRSVFHINSSSGEDSLHQEMQDCFQGIEEFLSAMKNLDGAGTHLTESLAQVLRGTQFQQVGEQMSSCFRDVYGSQDSQQFLEQLKELELLLSMPIREGSPDDLKMLHAQTSCHVLLLFAKLQKQYFQMNQQKIADLIQHLLSAKDPDHQVTKFILKVGLAEELSSDKIVSLPSTPWGSPKLRKALSSLGSPKSQNRSSGFKFFSRFERKPSPEEGRSAFYVSVPKGEEMEGEQSHEVLVDVASQSTTAGSLGSMAAAPEGSLLGSVPLVTRTDEMNNECAPEFNLDDPATSHLATEEDIDSVINLLSGINCNSPLPSPTAPPTPNSMLSIPEDPLRDTSSTPNSMHSGPEIHPPRSPMQLTVPSLYRMRSPASDTQVDELQLPKLQAQQLHRRSEGCLDLSGVGGNSWPHHHHHRASLPAVQLHSPYRQSYDSNSEPLVPPGCFLSQDFVPPCRPPVSYLGSNNNGGSSSTLSRAGMMMSGPQWSSSFSGVEMRSSGTWPLYQTPNMPVGDPLNSSWSGAHDGSDGSDDSSNGDHFFAVGKDLVSAIDSRHESSDEEGDGGKNKLNKDFFDYDRQTGCTNTWPMMQHLPGPGLHFPPAADFPDFLDPPPPPPHRPLQMQWSDPVATHNIWSAANPGMAAHKASQALPHTHSNSQAMPGYGRLT